jgi:hypothetical protein
MRHLAEFENISISPTCFPLYHCWHEMPLTALGRSPVLHSAGFILCSTPGGHVFKWILQLIVETLPSEDITRTILSDNDPGLNCPFETPINPDMMRLHRVACFSQNLNHFITLVDKECDACLHFLTEHGVTAVHTFIESSVVPRLDFISRTRRQHTWALGYLTSCIFESANARQMAFVGNHRISFSIRRELIITIEEQANINRRRGKGRKIPRISDPLVQCLVNDLGIDRGIPGEVTGAFVKTHRPSLSPPRNRSHPIHNC